VDRQFSDLLTEIVLLCDRAGTILYANPAATHSPPGFQEGQHFLDRLLFDNTHKGEKFFEAARAATPAYPTPPWELLAGPSPDYAVVTLRGYQEEGERVVLVGQVQAEEVNVMQREMAALTSELVESQREVQRQNRVLYQALKDQRELVRTIVRLTALSVPIWDGSLLLSFVRTSDVPLLPAIVKEIWQRAGEPHAHYVIVDLSDLSLAAPEHEHAGEKLAVVAQVLHRLGVQMVLADAGSGIGHRIRQIGGAEASISLHRDIHQALAYVGSHLAEA
jgi:hypothetical protein